MPEKPSFRAVQTETGWSRVLFSFAEWISPEPGWKALDVGCGPGLLPSILAGMGCKTYGVDSDLCMFYPHPLHEDVAGSDAYHLPFAGDTFDLACSSNLLFLLPDPVRVLVEMKRVVKPGGRVALLNPSERLSLRRAQETADERRLEGAARDSLLDWASRAEANQRWDETQTRRLYEDAGLQYERGECKVGPGFARFSQGRAPA